MERYQDLSSLHNETEGYKAVFPRGRSMRPFIKGGNLVWCEPKIPGKPFPVKRGDLIWFRDGNNAQFIHRVTSIIDHEDVDSKELITRGDPMVISESITFKDVLGKAVYVEADNTCRYSLYTGWTGLCCSVYGKMTEFIHRLDRMGKNGAQYTDRNNMLFKGRLFKLITPIFTCIFHLLLNFYLFFAGLARWQQRNARQQRNINIIQAVFNKKTLPGNLLPQDAKLLIEHELAGMYGEAGQYSDPHWQPLREQKKRQLYVVMQLQFFWEHLLKRCKEVGIPVIPLKGLSLSLSIYDDDPSVRRVGDIDLLVTVDKLNHFAKLLEEFKYLPKKPEALEQDYQQVKHKAEFFCKDPNFPDLDIHTAVVVKKILTHYTALDIDGVFKRAVTQQGQTGAYQTMDQVDEWLFLAYHLVLHHRISGIKWIIDLQRLLHQFNAQDWQILLERATLTGLNKTTEAALQAIEAFSTIPDFCAKRPKTKLGPFGRVALADALNRTNIFKMKNKHGGAGFLSKLDAGIWELHFIDSTAEQFRSIPRFMFPSYSFFKTIFGVVPFPVYCLALPFIPPSVLLLLTIYAANVLVKSIQLWSDNGK